MKYFIVEEVRGNVVIIRNGDEEFKVGDWFGGREVLKIEAYQKELKFCSPGLTAIITLSGEPTLVAQANSEEEIECYKEMRARWKSYPSLSNLPKSPIQR